MKLLHTSDWHLGRSLYGRKRHEESEAFLGWLERVIAEERIDALLVAGDVFDTSTPSNLAQRLYYRFLCRVSNTSCRHVVVVGGNHDSPSFLNAPRELLEVMNVHVVGSASESPADEVIVLHGAGGAPELIVCAVPYLRDREIRSVEAGESPEDKDRKLADGVREHYQAVCAYAEARRNDSGSLIPVVAMGHLYVAGGQTVDGDGVRELYVGSLARVGADIFPPSVDYVALGHLHVPQMVGGTETIRYSGSPVPMGFGEAKQDKVVYLVEVGCGPTTIRGVVVPRFQEIVRVEGDWAVVREQLEELKSRSSGAWIEIVYTGSEVAGNLREKIDQCVEGSGLEVLRVKNERVRERALAQGRDDESLEDLDVNDVFEKCLDAHMVPGERRAELVRAYGEIVNKLNDEDARAA